MSLFDNPFYLALCKRQIREYIFTGVFPADPDFIQAVAEPRPQTSGRNDEITRRFQAGESLEQIGADFGITRERVRQIVKRRGLTGKDGGRHVRAQRAQQERLVVKQVRRDAKKQARIDFINRVVECRASGMGWVETAIHLGYQAPTVTRGSSLPQRVKYWLVKYGMNETLDTLFPADGRSTRAEYGRLPRVLGGKRAA